MQFDLQRFRTFVENRYSRNLVFKTGNIEIIIACWRPGQETVLHDHGVSDGTVMVLEGEITNIDHYSNGEIVESVVTPGAIVLTPVGVKHIMANRSNRDAITMNIYTPPLDVNLKYADLAYDNEIGKLEEALPFLESGIALQAILAAAGGIDKKAANASVLAE